VENLKIDGSTAAMESKPGLLKLLILNGTHLNLVYHPP